MGTSFAKNVYLSIQSRVNVDSALILPLLWKQRAWPWASNCLRSSSVMSRFIGGPFN